MSWVSVTVADGDTAVTRTFQTAADGNSRRAVYSPGDPAAAIGTGSIAAPAPSSATAVTVAPSTGCPSPSKVSLTVIVLEDPDGVADTTARTPSSPWAPAIGAMAATPTPTTSRTARIAATMRTSGFCIPRSCPGRCDGTEHPGRNSRPTCGGDQAIGTRNVVLAGAPPTTTVSSKVQSPGVSCTPWATP